jgi:hypothetical protein
MGQSRPIRSNEIEDWAVQATVLSEQNKVSNLTMNRASVIKGQPQEKQGVNHMNL